MAGMVDIHNHILPDVDELLKLELMPVPKSKKNLDALIKQKEKEMREAAQNLDFELAALLRDEIKTLRAKNKETAKTKT